MPNYTPPSPHAVGLNFKDELTRVSKHNVELNFGVDEVRVATLEAVINTAFFAELIAESFTLNTLETQIQTSFTAEIKTTQGQLAQLNSVFSTGFTTEISVVRIDHFCTLEATIDTAFISDLTTRFDINHNVGVFNKLNVTCVKASRVLDGVDFKYSKPVLKALNRAFFYDKGLVLSAQNRIEFEKGAILSRAIRNVFDETCRTNSGLDILWQDNDRIKTSRSFVFENTEKLCAQRQFDWVELIRKRKLFTHDHEVAQYFEKTYQFEWDKGLELLISSHFSWDIAKPVHYVKHAIQPWPKPDEPNQTVKSKRVDLNFCCEQLSFERTAALLNFDVDRCKLKPSPPHVENKNWWYIVNEVSIINTRTNEEIIVLNGKYGSDRSRWCWSYSLTVAESEMSKIQKFDVLKIIVNGNVHMMMYEDYTKSQVFAKTIYTLSGRSQSALLESQYSPVRSFLQENERTSVQLVQAELDRVNSDTQLNWQLIDDLGWIVETESLSYTNQSPIDAIKMIAEAGGGFVYSEKDSNTFSIKPLYKKTYWDAMMVGDYDSLIPESLVTQHSESYQELLNYNAITLTNPRNGNTGQIKRRETAGDILLESVANPLFNAVSMSGFGRAKLAKSGRVEEHTFNMPISQKSPEQNLGDVFAFNGQWWGIVDAVDVSFTYSKVEQAVKVERIVNE